MRQEQEKKTWHFLSLPHSHPSSKAFSITVKDKLDREVGGYVGGYKCIKLRGDSQSSEDQDISVTSQFQ